MTHLPYLLIGSGFLLMALTGVGLFLAQDQWTDNTLSNSSLTEDSNTLWTSHSTINLNTLLKVHLFDVQNPEAVLQGHKPILKEVGPFTYEQRRVRTTIQLSTENDTVTYKDHIDYHFRPDLSSGELSDLVTIINLPWVGLAQELSKMSTISRLVVLGIVSRHNESIFMTRSVDELLFKGYYHDLMAAFSDITGESYMPNNTFGFFYGRNNTYTSTREINLGSKNPHNFGQTIRWKGLENMPWWDHNCNKYRGSDWTIFAPEITKETKLAVFGEDLCRNLRFQFESEVLTKGVGGHRFVVPESEVADPRVNSENMCYCTDPGDDECPKAGVWQIGACSKGAAILLSFPHFYEGDAGYLEECVGLQPDRNRHQTFLNLEPTTGQVLRSSKRIQVNLHLRPLRSVQEFRKVRNMVFPVVWTEETSEITEEALDELRLQSGSISVMLLGSGGLMVVGCVMVAVGVSLMVVRARRRVY